MAHWPWLLWCFGGFYQQHERLLPWWGFKVLSYFILWKNVLETDSSHLLAFKMEKRWRPKVVPSFSESENPSVLVAKQLICGCIIHIKRVPFFNPGGVALPSLSAVLLKGYWSRLWAALVFTEGYWHGQSCMQSFICRLLEESVMQSGSFREKLLMLSCRWRTK